MRKLINLEKKIGHIIGCALVCTGALCIISALVYLAAMLIKAIF